jgi:hypothetical protein
MVYWILHQANLKVVGLPQTGKQRHLMYSNLLRRRAHIEQDGDEIVSVETRITYVFTLCLEGP